MIEIRRDDPTSPELAALLALHVEGARAHTPPENAHVLEADELADAAITFWSAWLGGELAGMAALRELDAAHGELKSMRTAPTQLRRGVARALLAQVVAEARRRGYARVSLETGTAPAFDAANRLYEATGFIDCPVFADYPVSPHNRFMTLDLGA